MAENKMLHQKLLAVQKQVNYLQKSTKGERMGYDYVSSSQVLKSVREAMDAEGLLLGVGITDATIHFDKAYLQGKSGPSHLTELHIEFTWINADDPEDCAAYGWYGQGVDQGEKGVGKALTYAEKYFLLKYFHIATDKDDPDSYQNEDANGNPHTTRKIEVPAPPADTWGKDKADKFRAAADAIGMPPEIYQERLAYYGVTELEALPEKATQAMRVWLDGQRKGREEATNDGDA